MNRRNVIKAIGATWITPVVSAVTLPAHAQTSAVPLEPPSRPPAPPSDTPPPGGDTECPDEWTKSSLTMTGNVVCNTGDGPSLCPLRYSIIISEPVLPPVYTEYERGLIDPLGDAGCYDFTSHLPEGVYVYCITVWQDEGHPGQGFVRHCDGQGK